MASEAGKTIHSPQALIEPEKLASKMLDASLNGLYIYDVKLGKNVFINPQYTALTGYSLEDLLAMDMTQFFALFHPDDRQSVAGHMEGLIHNNEDRLEIEYRFKTKDKRWIWCLSRDSVFARGEDGSVSQLIGTFFDITDRKQVEQKLREREIRYRELVQNSNSAIIRWRCDGSISFFNEYAQMFFGYSAEEIIGRHVNILVPGKESTGRDLTSLAQDIIDNPQRYTSNINENVCRDGRRVWMTWTNRAIVDEHGKVVEILAVGSDITKQKRAEEALRESENKYRTELELEVKRRTAQIQKQYHELEELNAIIKKISQHTIKAMESDRKALSKEIHDSIAGTLSAVKLQLEAYLDLSLQGLPSHLMPIEKIAAHLGNAIRETRDISLQLRSRTLDDFGLKAALVEHIQRFKQFYPEIRIISEIEIGDENISPEVQTVVYRVVQEALNNAGKHSSATEVHVKLAENQNRFWLEVADNGCGFNPHKVLSDTQSLAGYGIYSMRERIEICKGNFEIRSAPGRGTAIHVSIPV
jgi:PAS domain S-box-containing protein